MTKVIGLISGTSVDGIDAALVEITGSDIDLKVKLLAGETFPYPAALRERILAVCAGAAISMAELAELDDAIAQAFAQAAQAIQKGHPTAELIGSHGQTVYHRPPRSGGAFPVTSPVGQASRLSKPVKSPQLGYTLQLGRGALIAQMTGITTVSNFRVADIAFGGQGAPLVSRVDAFLLSHPTEHRCVQNIGGIGNVTYLPPRSQNNWLEAVRGWDTGPGNALLDLAVEHLTGGSQTYDKDGAGAASGTPCLPLVERWLQQEFFHQPPPKSTGRELFGVDYLRQCLVDAEEYHLSSADLLATLTELTAASIVHSYRNFLPQMPDMALLCGGGSHNLYLKQRLQVLFSQAQTGETQAKEQSSKGAIEQESGGAGELLSGGTTETSEFTVLSSILEFSTQNSVRAGLADESAIEKTIDGKTRPYKTQNYEAESPAPVLTTDEVGLSADYKEAIAFAVLAYWRHLDIPGNLTQVTGAQRTICLGDIHLVADKVRVSIESCDRTVGNQSKG